MNEKDRPHVELTDKDWDDIRADNIESDRKLERALDKSDVSPEELRSLLRTDPQAYIDFLDSVYWPKQKTEPKT